jgi:cephalosporin-C deacetylase-like acetyl esterase
MRKDIEFKAEEGTLLRGWHYLPDQRTGKVPTVVMAHGFASVKEMHLDKYAELFCTSV